MKTEREDRKRTFREMLDKRSNSERYTISKKQYIKDKNHLSELQDKYRKRLISKGYDLERGTKNSDNEILI